MLRIHLLTGLAWTKSIEVEGDRGSDLLQLIDDYYTEKGSLPVPMYTLPELEEIFETDELEDVLDEMLPINGGEFWVDGISHIEEI